LKDPRQKKNGRPRGRPRKNAIAPIVTLEDSDNDGEVSDNDPDR
jgi:hypothetical protein